MSYKAPGPAFDADTAHLQTVHDSKTVLLGAGSHTLTVLVPNCYYQVDFVYGDVIATLGPAGSSNFYSAQGRLIKARNGGSGACMPPPPDECPNLEGSQTSVPAGMRKDASGNCVTPPPPPPPTDECPNIEGNQASVPAGMIKDSSGTCFTPSTPPPVETTVVTATPAAAVVPAIVTPPAAKPAPKAKVTVKKKAKKAKKKIVKKKKKVVVKKQQTAKKTKPRALPFTP